MSPELLTALAPFLERFRNLVQSDPRLRSDLAMLGRAITALADGTPRPDTPNEPPTSLPPVAATTVPPQHWVSSPSRRTDDREHHSEEPLGWMPQEPAIIAARCRAKGAAAKLMWQRCSNAIDEQQYLHALTDVRANAEKLPKCSLWMLDLSLTRSAVVWEDLTGGYETSAEAAELLQVVTDPTSKVETDHILLALNLAAEAQSLLFSAVIDTGNTRPDADQIQLYVTVRELAAARGTYIHRYLRREDRVDPRTWPDLRKRIAAANEPFHEIKKRSGNTKKLVSNLRFKLKKAQTDGPGKYDEWPRVVELLDEAISAGMSVGDPEIREAMLPVVDHIPEDVMIPVAVANLLRELDRYLVSHPAPSLSAQSFSAETQQVAMRLQDRTVLIVGGLPRETERSAIQLAFGLATVDWITLPEQAMELDKAIGRPGDLVVLYSVRWSGDSFAEVQRLCTTHRKQLVRLPGGYSPQAIAQEIVKQLGKG